jgi:hypothetical protein
MGDLVGRAERARPAGKTVSDPGSERGLTPRVKFALAHTPAGRSHRGSWAAAAPPSLKFASHEAKARTRRGATAAAEWRILLVWAV